MKLAGAAFVALRGQGEAVEVGFGAAGLGRARTGGLGQEWRGPGPARFGMARRSGHGSARHGQVRRSWFVTVSYGMAK